MHSHRTHHKAMLLVQKDTVSFVLFLRDKASSHFEVEGTQIFLSCGQRWGISAAHFI